MTGSSSKWSPEHPTPRAKIHTSHTVIPTMKYLYEEVMCTRCNKHDDPFEVKNLIGPCTGDPEQ